MRNFNIALVLALSILSCLEMGKGSRLLHEEAKTLEQNGVFDNLHGRGPVPPSGASGCTHIPGSAGNPCPIDGMRLGGSDRLPRSGGTAASPPPVISFGVGTLGK